jgi:predicted lactoylglutathione lyase
MKIKDIVNETTSAGGVATVATPVGGMLSRQMKNPDGTVKNALDVDVNIMGGPKNKKKSKKA